ncbi:MAG TPA: DUF1501 domain-containing protein [Pirellulales bacterium]|nr:DUF1501 domain-containing protein [Pirellulales bacterium]
MIPLYGSQKRLCDGFSRRDLLHIGGLGAFGLSVDLFTRLGASQAAQSSSASHFGQAKACILLFLFGSPAQHETFDPKPGAPDEVKGEMGPISTVVPGLQICEGLPRTAQVMDRLTVVRSMTHQFPLHGVAYALTGMPTYTPAIEDLPRDPAHWPFIGSIVDQIELRRAGGRLPEIPRNIGLPWLFGSRSTDKPPLSGPYAAFLGRAHDPVWTSYEGKPTKIVPKLSPSQGFDVHDHFAGVEPGGRFVLSAARQEDISSERFASRRSLLSQFDDARARLEGHVEVETYVQQRQAAYSLLSSPAIRDALDIQREPAAVREEYGMTLFGQAALAARRLVEAGSKFVSVFWDPVGPYGISVWDTHANHFPRLKNYLLPVFDQTYPALIRDLDQRGLLDETLVVCLSEHGRTPKISNAQGGGRDHWSRAYSAVLAGGGIARGKVVGRSDRIGGDVENTPVSPKDILATTFHLLGIDPHTQMTDRLNRPLPIAGSGVVRHELF